MCQVSIPHQFKSKKNSARLGNTVFAIQSTYY
jgi:hypothetical protein